MTIEVIRENDPGATDLLAWFAAAAQHGEDLRQAEPAADPTLTRSCCPKATRASRCACIAHTTCSVHGERHYGTHD